MGISSQVFALIGITKQDYVIWLVYEEEVRWLRRQHGRFLPVAPDEEGVVRSTVFPGLWLDVPAMCRSDLAAVLQRLHAGLATPAHAAFRERLHRAGSPP